MSRAKQTRFLSGSSSQCPPPPICSLFPFRVRVFYTRYVYDPETRKVTLPLRSVISDKSLETLGVTSETAPRPQLSEVCIRGVRSLFSLFSANSQCS